MLQFLLKRIALLIPTFIGITFIAFGFVRVLPGDPVLLMAGERGLKPERYAKLLEEFGFDRPIWEQYWDYLVGILHGDFGTSLISKKPVLEEFLILFPATIELTLAAVFIAIVVGIPAGIIAASKRGTFVDQSIMGTALVGYSMPIFWWGLLLIMIFSSGLHWTPVSGRISLLYYFPDGTGFMLIDSLASGQPGAFKSAVMHLILPSCVMSTIGVAILARQTRSAMLEVMGEDYVRTAYAKGLSKKRVIGVHAFRNALIPVVTVVGLYLGTVLSGAILTETIFSWPGIGKWMIDSISRRDYPVVQSGLLFIAGVVMIVNLIVDMTYGLINPRIRHH